MKDINDETPTFISTPYVVRIAEVRSLEHLLQPLEPFYFPYTIFKHYQNLTQKNVRV